MSSRPNQSSDGAIMAFSERTTQSAIVPPRSDGTIQQLIKGKGSHTGPLWTTAGVVGVGRGLAMGELG